jgi:hypothetical protein
VDVDGVTLPADQGETAQRREGVLGGNGIIARYQLDGDVVGTQKGTDAEHVGNRRGLCPDPLIGDAERGRYGLAVEAG